MVKANLKMTVRNRQALFWNLAFPAIFILIFGAVFSDDNGVSFDVGVTGVGIAVRDGGGRRRWSRTMRSMSILATRTEELDKLKDSDRDYVMVFASSRRRSVGRAGRGLLRRNPGAERAGRAQRPFAGPEWAWPVARIGVRSRRNRWKR